MRFYTPIFTGLALVLMAQGSCCEDLDGDGWTGCDGDCDDENADVHPGASEVCDGLDNDCDRVVDNEEAVLGEGEECAAASCLEILETRTETPDDGIYYIDPEGSGAFAATCDMSGGGWTVGQSVFLEGSGLEYIGHNDDPTCEPTTPNFDGDLSGFAGITAETSSHHHIATGADLLTGQFEVSMRLSYEWAWASFGIDQPSAFDSETLAHTGWSATYCGGEASENGRIRISNNASNNQMNANWTTDGESYSESVSSGQSSDDWTTLLRDENDNIHVYYGDALMFTYPDPLEGPLRMSADIQMQWGDYGGGVEGVFVRDLEVRWLGD